MASLRRCHSVCPSVRAPNVRSSICCRRRRRRFITKTEPWMHVICTFGGAWVATKWVRVEKDLLADINELRANHGLPPMVGSHYYFPFVPNLEIDESEK
jgi:hypothetical protein